MTAMRPRATDALAGCTASAFAALLCASLSAIGHPIDAGAAHGTSAAQHRSGANLELGARHESVAARPGYGAHCASPAPRLERGLGTLHHPVSTRVALAQRYFDQGLAYVYAFNHQEAVRSFRHAAALDPQLAIARWGIALALGPNYNAPDVGDAAIEARAELEQSSAIAARNAATTPLERELIAALALRFADQPDAKTIAPGDAYAHAMREIARQHPDDPDAQTLFADAMMTPRAWRMWNRDGTAATGTDEIVATLERVLARHPDHIGANHLYIHAVEASPDPARALPSADRLSMLAPSAGHLLHMPAHIYDRVGEHAKAARANAAAIAADRAYFATLRGSNPYSGYFRHNLGFLAVAHANAGNYRAAMQAAQAFAKDVAKSVPSIPHLERYLPAPTLIAVKFERWNDVSKLPPPPRETASLRAVWHFAQGMAQAAKGRLAAAERERENLGALIDAMPDGESWARNDARDVFRVASGLLDGKIALLRDDPVVAAARFEAAARAQDALAYDEPAPWIIPPREAWGELLLAQGDRAGAERVLRDEQRLRPGSFRTLALLRRLGR